ncbi:MAG: sigma-70 family RNA polymerase sigma factor [Proteobacteria bacterium]|nr:sigma-70 family RNA polymerase sigma factor [Pseudomonadota bacterium]
MLGSTSVSLEKRQFHSTQWSLVLQAGEGSNDALHRLCARYWYPLYAYARRSGISAIEAQDLTQGFFASLLSRNDIAHVSRSRGKFRSYLLSALRNYISKQRDRAGALKRGGGKVILSLDWQDAEGRYCFEPADDMDAEKLFAKRWALTLLDRVVTKLREDYEKSGKAKLFGYLSGAVSGDGIELSYREIAQRLNTTEGAVKAAVHRLRKRYQKELLAEVAETVDDVEAVEEELMFLMSTLE